MTNRTLTLWKIFQFVPDLLSLILKLKYNFDRYVRIRYQVKDVLVHRRCNRGLKFITYQDRMQFAARKAKGETARNLHAVCLPWNSKDFMWSFIPCSPAGAEH